MTPSLHFDDAYFRSMYDADPDPWGFDDRWYERRKFALTAASLPRARYEHAYEPGCANGALTELLAGRCDRLTACELIPDVAARARHRLQRFGNIIVVDASFPDYWPPGGGDLVVLSEVAYYLTPEGLRHAGLELSRWLRPGGDVVAVHYTGSTNYPLHASDVADWLDRVGFLDRCVTLRDDGFELGVWRRGDEARR